MTPRIPTYALLMLGACALAAAPALSDVAIGAGNAVVTASDSTYSGEMVYVPAGSFLMGNSGAGDDTAYGKPDESPQHLAHLSDFWLGKYEVTRGEYRQFMNAGGYSNPSLWSSAGWVWKEHFGRTEPYYWDAEEIWGSPPGAFTQSDCHPVVGVSYYEAEAFCKWAGGHLPTEAQWEKAARWTGTHPNVYPWGDTWDQQKCNSISDSLFPGSQTAPVGRYPSGASPCGCQDMGGNAWEWCQDWYLSSYYSQSPKDDPQGPVAGSYRVQGYTELRGKGYPQGPLTGSYRVLRGGGWASKDDHCRCAHRRYDTPSRYMNPYYYYGFRVARQRRQD
jgi:gamma-glutamyl hercynylcysteine S-oxide synthase